MKNNHTNYRIITTFSLLLFLIPGLSFSMEQSPQRDPQWRSKLSIYNPNSWRSHGIRANKQHWTTLSPENKAHLEEWEWLSDEYDKLSEKSNIGPSYFKNEKTNTIQYVNRYDYIRDKLYDRLNPIHKAVAKRDINALKEVLKNASKEDVNKAEIVEYPFDHPTAIKRTPLKLCLLNIDNLWGSLFINFRAWPEYSTMPDTNDETAYQCVKALYEAGARPQSREEMRLLVDGNEEEFPKTVKYIVNQMNCAEICQLIKDDKDFANSQLIKSHLKKCEYCKEQLSQ